MWQQDKQTFRPRDEELYPEGGAPTFAFTPHLKLIPLLCVCESVCVCSGRPASPPALHQHKERWRESSVGGGKAKVSVSGNADRAAIKIPFSVSFWWNSRWRRLKAGLITNLYPPETYIPHSLLLPPLFLSFFTSMCHFLINILGKEFKGWSRMAWAVFPPFFPANLDIARYTWGILYFDCTQNTIWIINKL